MDTLIYCGCSLICITAHFVYFREMFGFKRSPYLFYLCGLGFEVASATILARPGNPFWNMCMNWLYAFLAACYFCKGTVKKKAILISVFILLALFFEPVLTVVIVQLGISTPEAIYTNPKLLNTIYFIEWSSMVGIFQILGIVMKNRLNRATGSRHGLGVLFISVCSVTVSLIHCINMVKNNEYTWENVIVLVLLFLISLMCYYFFLVGEDKNRLEMEYKVYEEQVKLYSQWIEEQKQAQNVMAAFRHDMKNHIVALKGICSRGLQDGETKGLQEVSRYLDGIGTNYEIGKVVVNSGNVLIDAILNMKLNYARSLGIEATAKVTVPKDWNYDGLDMVILMGNLLDNAAEACEPITEEKKKTLHMEVQYDKGNVFIRMENGYSGEYDGASGCLSENRLPKTTKKDKQAHGIGLANVSEVVRKYHGELCWRTERGVFFTEVLLYGIEQK